jgi:hypothetical protein
VLFDPLVLDRWHQVRPAVLACNGGTIAAWIIRGGRRFYL